MRLRASPPAIFFAKNCCEAAIRAAFTESVKARFDVVGVQHLVVGRARCVDLFACACPMREGPKSGDCVAGG